MFGATPNTSAVSSTLKPPKKRISKTLLLRSSVLSSRCKARSTATISSTCSGERTTAASIGDVNGRAAAFQAVFLPRVVHQSVTHHLGSDCEKVRPIAPFDAWSRQEPEKDFLHKRRGLHGVVLAFVTEMTARKAVEFRTNQG